MIILNSKEYFHLNVTETPVHVELFVFITAIPPHY